MKPLPKILIISLLIIFPVLLMASYYNAKVEADEIMKPFLQDDLYYYGTSFHPLSFDIENGNNKIFWGPSWWVSYDHKKHMISGPLSFRINIFGKIIETNPENLLDEIIPAQLKQKNRETI